MKKIMTALIACAFGFYLNASFALAAQNVANEKHFCICPGLAATEPLPGDNFTLKSLTAQYSADSGGRKGISCYYRYSYQDRKTKKVLSYSLGPIIYESKALNNPNWHSNKCVNGKPLHCIITSTIACDEVVSIHPHGSALKEISTPIGN